MDAVVERVKELLLAVKEIWKPLREAAGPHAGLKGQPYRTLEYRAFLSAFPQASRSSLAASLTFIPPVELELAPTFAYTSPYLLLRQSHVIASVCRLFLLHHIASLAEKPDELAALAKRFEGLIAPPRWAQFWGPKVVARPGELSSVEYLQMTTFTPVILLPSKEEACYLFVGVGQP